MRKFFVFSILDRILMPKQKSTQNPCTPQSMMYTSSSTTRRGGPPPLALGVSNARRLILRTHIHSRPVIRSPHLLITRSVSPASCPRAFVPSSFSLPPPLPPHRRSRRRHPRRVRRSRSDPQRNCASVQRQHPRAGILAQPSRHPPAHPRPAGSHQPPRPVHRRRQPAPRAEPPHRHHRRPPRCRGQHPRQHPEPQGRRAARPRPSHRTTRRKPAHPPRRFCILTHSPRPIITHTRRLPPPWFPRITSASTTPPQWPQE